jgi:hypothetical protein
MMKQWACWKSWQVLNNAFIYIVDSISIVKITLFVLLDCIFDVPAVLSTSLDLVQPKSQDCIQWVVCKANLR